MIVITLSDPIVTLMKIHASMVSSITIILKEIELFNFAPVLKIEPTTKQLMSLQSTVSIFALPNLENLLKRISLEFGVMQVNGLKEDFLSQERTLQ